MKVLFLGDLHGNVQAMRNDFAHACRLEADRIIQVGDFGYGWERRPFDGHMECAFTREVERMVALTGIPFFWLDGNHENFDMLGYAIEGNGTMNVAPATPQKDGTYQFRPGVWYIPRGTLLEWGEKRILVCGGAASVDKNSRKPFISWWPQELITDEDVAKCAKAGKADLLITHDLPLEVTVIDRHLDPIWGPEPVETTYMNRKRMSEILAECGARLQIHGHLHWSYTEETEVNHKPVKVIGLDRDTTPSFDHTHLLEV